VIFNTAHPEDGRRRRPKHVGVVSKQPIKFLSAFVGFFIKHVSFEFLRWDELFPFTLTELCGSNVSKLRRDTNIVITRAGFTFEEFCLLGCDVVLCCKKCTGIV
jgi:hypothetical protein